MNPPSIAALIEFGGLQVEQHGPGVDLARESFVMNPTRAIGAEAVFDEYSDALHSCLSPIGEFADQAFLAIASNGAVFMILDDLYLVGDSLDAALSNLIRGKRPDHSPGADVVKGT
jgi:hypothetical protein